MEFQSLEFTVEDILLMHRDWITKLYVEERKTEVEIVEQLYERHLVVTLGQIRKCITDWNLVPLLDPQGPTSSSHTPSPGRSNVPEPPTSSSRTTPQGKSNEPPTSSSVPQPPTSPTSPSKYINRPLPALPSNDPSGRSSPYRIGNFKGRLRLTCHHGDEPSESHEVESTLDDLPEGPSQLEMYAETEQGHERIAVGLERRSIRYARSGERMAARCVGVIRTSRYRLRYSKDGEETRRKRRREDGKD